MSRRILFFGNERLATGVTTDAPVFRALLAAGYEVGAVVVTQQAVGPSRKARELEIAAVAAEHKVPLLAPEDLESARDELLAYGATAAVLVAYGRLVPAGIIDLFPKGVLNIHPSLLPKHRGPTPIESVILNGEPETGVSLIRLAPELDAGPVYAQASMPLNGTESKQALADKLAGAGSDLLVRSLPSILDDSLQPTPQIDAAATYDHKIDAAAGRLDWRKPADRLAREVRAYAGWPRSRTTLGGVEVIITEASALRLGDGVAPGRLMQEKKRLFVGTGKDWLEIKRLQPAGKKEMTAEAFLAGYSLS